MLVFAVVVAKTRHHVITSLRDLGKRPTVRVSEARVLKMGRAGRMPMIYYLPCPRDTSLTKLEIIEDEEGEVYFGRCRYGHQLMVSSTPSSSS